MKKRSAAAVTLAVAAAAVGCSDPASPGDQGDQQMVSVAFAAQADDETGATGQIVLEGDNGTLLITDLRVIVDRFELKRTNDDDCAEEDHSCERFRAGPLFVDVPLDGGTEVAITEPVEPGSYRRFRFEIEDLDDDEDNPTQAARIAELLNTIRDEIPDWPRDASMMVSGTFTPDGGEPRPFRVFFEAEVEIRMELEPPAVISDDGDGARFTVVLDPSLWFSFSNGTVRDLSQLDFDATNRVEEFEVEIRDGFAEIEFDD